MRNIEESAFGDLVSSAVMADVTVNDGMGQEIVLRDVPIIDLANSLTECALLAAVNGHGEAFLWDSGESVAIESIGDGAIKVALPVGRPWILTDIFTLMDNINDISKLAAHVIISS